jgi:hypothetical protein
MCLRAVMWVAFILWVVLVLYVWPTSHIHEDSAIRDAANSASACLGVLAGYVVCRAIDSATRR